MKKKVASIGVFAVVILCIMMGANLSVSAAVSSMNQSDYDSKVNSFINDSRWKNGISWEAGQDPKLSSWNSTGCFAYTADFVKYMFGREKPQDGDVFTNASEIRAGDVVYADSTPHYIVVLSRSGNKLRTAEGNWGGKVNISDSAYYISGSTVLCNNWSGFYYNKAYHQVNITNSKPSNLSIYTDMQIYSESETVSFNISAKNATKYTVEMSCNGENLSSKNVSGNFSYTPERTGTYQARLIASNSAGTVYSDWISFVVGIGSRSTVGDFNGDGRDDYASLYDLGDGRSQWHVFLSTGTGFSEEIWWTENTVGWYNATFVSGRVAAGDFNGDGLDDIAVMYSYSQYDASIHVFHSNGKEFDYYSTWIEMKDGYQSSLVIDRISAGDFNGDGLDDIAVMYGYTKYRTEIHVFLSTGTVFQGWQTWFADSSYESSRTAGRFTAGDFNGDGLDDIAAMFEYGLYNSCIHVFLSTGTSFQGWKSWFYSDGGYAANRITGRFTAGDFNGDGLDDVAAMYNYGDYIRIHVWISAGTIFNTISDFIEETQFNPLCVSGRFHGGDFDGDGLDDIATMYDYSSDHVIFHMYMSEQNKFRHGTYEWWNGINNYDAKKTTNIKGYGNYTPAFTFKKAEIPQLESAVFAVKGKRVTNTSNSSQTADIIVAKYDNGVLIDIKAETVTFAAKEAKLFEVDGNYTIFVWDSLSGMRPLAK